MRYIIIMYKNMGAMRSKSVVIHEKEVFIHEGKDW